MNSRQESIISLLKRQGTLTTQGLVDIFKVTEMTIRRDLAYLESIGALTRVHGGCRSSQNISFQLFMGANFEENAESKRAIARKCLHLIAPGENIILDTGTNVFFLSDYLSGIEGLTVATPSLAVALNLYYHQNVEVIVLGGALLSGTPDLFGSLAEDNIKGMHFDKAFMGADGLI